LNWAIGKDPSELEPMVNVMGPQLLMRESELCVKAEGRLTSVVEEEHLDPRMHRLNLISVEEATI
jgi:hypothetical protein